MNLFRLALILPCLLGSVLSQAQNNSTLVSIGIFSEVPSEFDGCICYYSKTRMDIENKSYTFLKGSDGVETELVFIKIDGNLERLELVSRDRDNEMNTEEYKNEKFHVLLKIENKHTQVGPDSYTNKAQIIVSDLNGNIVSLNTFGLCAC